jgi:hypothetical protein
MPDIPVLRGWADETANIPQAIQGIVSAFNPKFPMQLQLMQHVSDPATLQAYANLEAKNPGITQQIFGQGRGTQAILGAKPDNATTRDINIRPQVQQISSDPGVATDIARHDAGLGSQAQETTEQNVAKASVYDPLIKGYETQAAALQPALAQAQLTGDRQKIEATQNQLDLNKQAVDYFKSRGNNPLTPEEVEKLPPTILNAVSASPAGQHYVQEIMGRYYSAAIMASSRAAQQASSEQARQQATQQRQDFVDRQQAWKDYGNVNAGDKTLSPEDYLNFRKSGATDLATVMGSSDPVSAIAANPDLQKYAKIADKFGMGVTPKLTAQTGQQIQQLTNAVTTTINKLNFEHAPNAKGVSKPLAPIENIAAQAKPLQDLYNKQASITGQAAPIVNIVRKNGQYSLQIAPPKAPTTSAPNGNGSGGGANVEDEYKNAPVATIKAVIPQLTPDQLTQLRLLRPDAFQ